MGKNLNWKIEFSQKILRKTFEKWGEDKIAVAWTGGKDSTVLLHLIKTLFGKVPFKVYFGDTTQHFPELYKFKDKLTKEWNLDIIVGKPKKSYRQVAGDREKCCYALKTQPLNATIKKYKWKALITGIRWDEQEARADEKYFSPRKNPPHIRVHPLLHWTEKDIWDYIQKYQLPVNPLYKKGYRSIGCKPCTKPQGGKVGDGKERVGRAQDKEKIMARLRALGYF
jgi:phosphoadenosine phosphosulfate reductase